VRTEKANYQYGERQKSQCGVKHCWWPKARHSVTSCESVISGISGNKRTYSLRRLDFLSRKKRTCRAGDIHALQHLTFLSRNNAHRLWTHCRREQPSMALECRWRKFAADLDGAVRKRREDT